MTTRVDEDLAPIQELTREEGRALFDQLTRRYLGMSGEEFIRAWDAGEFDQGPERLDVMHLAFFLPFVRES